MTILEDYKWRYATKFFDSKKMLATTQLQQLGEALRLAPSSFGLQPWKFIFISDPKIKEALFPVSWGNKQVLDCSHLVVMCAPLELGDKDVDRLMGLIPPKPNSSALTKYESIIKNFLLGLDDSKKQQYMSEQIHIALGFLLAAAASLKIDACPMGGFSPLDYDKILGLRERGLRSVVLCALGHRDCDDKYANAPKIRFQAEDIIEWH